MYRVLLFIFLLLFCGSATAQNVETTWVSWYTGTGNTEEDGYDIDIDSYGNVYVVGRAIATYGAWDYSLVTVKIEPDGDTAWTKRFLPFGYQSATGHFIKADDSGNVFAIGSTQETITFGDVDMVFLKFNSYGATIWFEQIDYGEFDYPTGMDLDADYIYITGTTGYGFDQDLVTTKRPRSGGTPVWSRIYNGSADNEDGANDIVVDGNGNVFVAGYLSNSSYNTDIFVIKYEPNGDTGWVYSYASAGGYDDEARFIALDNTGNVYITGTIGTSVPFASDYITIKLNSSGVQQWVSTYNGPSNDDDVPAEIGIDNAGNVYISGDSRGDDDDNPDFATIKYFPNGDTAWVRRYNGDDQGFTASVDQVKDMAVDTVGSIYVTGRSYSDAINAYDLVTIMYNTDGDEVWRHISGLGGTSYALTCDNAGHVYVTGASQAPSQTENTDICTIKLTKIISAVDEKISDQLPNGYTLEQNYPNPFNPTTFIEYTVPRRMHVTLTIYNLLGQEINTLVDEMKSYGTYRATWDGTDNAGRKVASGIYFYKLQSEDGIQSKKMIMLK
ncbi:MAG: SBBP repeat-containing protein [candidate division Zixibacteria bacterium]|nr:SBBP repeat-containing protein [candidate division Zixibacteria bacterium]